MSSSIAAFARRLKRVEEEQAAARTPQLAYSSIDDGAITVVSEGSVVAAVGVQHDGTFGAVPLDGPTPPVPAAPSVEGGSLSVTVAWDGRYASEADRAPLDFHVVEVYAATDEGMSDARRCGEFASEAGGAVTGALRAGVWWIGLRTKTVPGRRSDFSLPVRVEVAEGLDGGLLSDLKSTRDWVAQTGAELERSMTETFPEELAELRGMVSAGGTGAVVLFGDAPPTAAVSAPTGSVFWVRSAAGTIVSQWEQTSESGDAVWVERRLETGVLAGLDVAKLTASEAAVDEAVVQRLWGDMFRARKITTDLLMVGSGGNLLPNGSGLLGSALGWGDMAWDAFEKPGGYSGAFKVPSGATLVDVAGHATNASEFAPVQPGGELLLEFWLRASGDAAHVVTLDLVDRAGVSAVASSTRVSDSVSIVGGLAGSAATSGSWVKHEFVVRLRGDVSALRVGRVGVTYAGAPEDVWVGGVVLRDRLSASLIVDGAVSARSLSADALDGKTITGGLIRSAESGQRTQMDSAGFAAYNSDGSEYWSVGPESGGVMRFSVTPGSLLSPAPVALPGTATYSHFAVPGGIAATGWMDTAEPQWQIGSKGLGGGGSEVRMTAFVSGLVGVDAAGGYSPDVSGMRAFPDGTVEFTSVPYAAPEGPGMDIQVPGVSLVPWGTRVAGGVEFRDAGSVWINPGMYEEPYIEGAPYDRTWGLGGAKMGVRYGQLGLMGHVVATRDLTVRQGLTVGAAADLATVRHFGHRYVHLTTTRPLPLGAVTHAGGPVIRREVGDPGLVRVQGQFIYFNKSGLYTITAHVRFIGRPTGRAFAEFRSRAFDTLKSHMGGDVERMFRVSMNGEDEGVLTATGWINAGGWVGPQAFVSAGATTGQEWDIYVTYMGQ